jgi:hypothetical protein
VLDPRLWTSATSNGVSADEDNGHLELSMSQVLPPQAGPDPLYGRASTLCRFVGNFDVRVDYVLLDWAPGNGVILMLTAGFPGNSNTMSIGRSSWADKDGDGYTAYAPPGWTRQRASDDARGSLRVTRVGERLTTYYRPKGGAWHRLATFKRSLGAAGGVGPAVLTLQVFSPPGAFGGSAVKVAFDNFWVAAQGRTCA